MPTVFVEGEYPTAEVTNLSPRGMWILSEGREYFVDFDLFPEFQNATVRQIAEIHADVCGNFHWKSLDMDIERDSLLEPEHYPLVFRP